MRVSRVRNNMYWNGKSFSLFAIFMPIAMYVLLMMLFCLQWQIIGRIDDVTNIVKSTLLFYPHELSTSTLNTKINWSKIIKEERDCSAQILFGVMDLHVYPLLNLAACLEGEIIIVYCCLVVTLPTVPCQVSLTSTF